jgi:phospholipid-binding lipoprotein MlaA
MRIAVLRWATSCVACAVLVLTGCACRPGDTDPFESTNRFIYGLNEGLDRVLLKPASDVYVQLVPEPVRTGLGNAFANLGYFNVILNDFLQGQWDQGLRDAGRMAVNSTIGVAGIFDVATGWELPAHRNDFGLTLGKWGMRPGPYLVIPIVGPSSVRDAIGFGTIVVTNPLFWLNPPLAVTLPLSAIQSVDARSGADAGIRFRNEAAIDPYIFTRDTYMQYRRNLIQGYQLPQDQWFYDEEMGPPSPPTSEPEQLDQGAQQPEDHDAASARVVPNSGHRTGENPAPPP